MIECVPNFSEGTDRDTIEQIISSIKACPILDVHSDTDHNRSVVTFTGPKDKVIQSAFEMTQTAIHLIDINQHQGEHPFIGSVDVIPFIPLKGSSMRTAVAAARTLGKMLWQKLALPVYFYGRAAKIPQRVDLPFVRKGGLAALREQINLPEKIPDIGNKLHPYAGAVAIGARDFLIAFNVNLSTSNVQVAESIAKEIREKRSGMKGVRALGLYLASRNLAQVSINITDIVNSPLEMVFEKVEYWAGENDVEILESEIVGLIPPQAVFLGMERTLKIRDFSKKKILLV